MGNLYTLVYVSTAAHSLSMDQIGRLLDETREKNLELNVTGVLLYSGGNFMQCLEGSADSLARAYELIKSDSLHFGIIDLLREPIETREFAEWSTAFRVEGAMGNAAPEHQDELLSRKLATSDEPVCVSRALLAKFWNLGRRAVATHLLELSTARSGPTLSRLAAKPSVGRRSPN